MFYLLIYNIMKTKLLIYALITFGFSNAQNIFRDDFSAYTVNSQLNTQGGWTNDSQTFGLGGCSGIPCTNTNVVANSLSYANYGSSTKSVQMTIKLDNPGRAINPIISSGTFYVATLINTTDAPTTAAAADFIRIANGSNSSIAFRLLMQQNGFGYKFGVRKGFSSSPLVLSNDTYNIGETALIIMKYTIVSGADNNIFNLFVNPDYANGEPVNPTLTTSLGNDADTNIDRLALRFGSNSLGSLPNGFISLVSVARTWADLGFPPLATNQFDSSNISVFANNATNGILNINSNVAMNNVNLNLYTISGALIEKQTINLTVNSNQIKINQLNQNSLYIAELIDENGNKYTKKITLN